MNPTACGSCNAGPCGGKGRQTLKEGLWSNNPIAIQVLGICSALAVTSRIETALVMGIALVLTCAFSNLFASLLRNITPGRIRIIVELTIIAAFVITFDQFLKAFYWDMSKKLGPYVGLIITNCIVMGRMEAFALQNRPLVSIVDGAANGGGYGIVLLLIAVFREALGTGALFGVPLAPAGWYQPNQLMILAPGAFFTLALIISVYNLIRARSKKKEDKKP